MTSSYHANVQDLLLIDPLEEPEVVWAVAVARRRVLDITSAFSSHGACPMQVCYWAAPGVALHGRAVCARVAGVEGTCWTGLNRAPRPA